MKRRIVREIYKDNTVKYRIEKYKIFSGWSIENKVEHLDYMIDEYKPLRFDTLE